MRVRVCLSVVCMQSVWSARQEEPAIGAGHWWAGRAAAGRTAVARGLKKCRWGDRDREREEGGGGAATVICGLDCAEDSQKGLRHVRSTL